MKILLNKTLPILGIIISFFCRVDAKDLKLKPEYDFRNKDFSHKDLTEMKELQADGRNSLDNRPHFDGSNFEKVFLHKGILAAISMKNVNLKSADLSHAKISQVDFENADLEGCDFSHANIREGANFKGTNLKNAKLRNAFLNSFDGRGFPYKQKILWPKDFDWKNQGMWGAGVNLKNQDFRGDEYLHNFNKMHNSGMPNADISGSNFATKRDGQWYNWNLQGITAVGTIFTSSDRRRSTALLNCKDAKLRNAVFKNAQFIGANFINADLSGVDFSGSSFSNGTTFKRANLTGVNWKGATYNKSVIWDESFDPLKAGLTLKE